MGRTFLAAALCLLSTVAATGADDSGKLVGRVTDRDGKPVAGAVARVMIAPALSSGGNNICTGTSDEQGNYAVSVPFGHAMCLAMEAPGGLFCSEAGITHFTTSASQPTHRVDMTLDRGTPLTLAFADGMERAKSIYVVRPAKERFSVYKSASKTGPTMVTLPKDGGEIMMSILDDSARWLSYAKIEMQDGFDPARVGKIAATDDGRSEVVDAEGRKAVVLGPTATESDGRLTLHVKPGLGDLGPLRKVRIAGRVADAGDQPIAGAEVRFGRANAAGAGSSSNYVATSAADGTFALDAEVNDGQGKEAPYFFLIVTRDGTAGALTKHAAIPPGMDTVEVAPIKLAEGHAVRLRVVDDAGQPLAGAWIEPGEAYLSAANFVRTDREGRCLARNLAAGVIRISARYGSLHYNEKIVVDDQAAGEEITLRTKPPQPAQAQARPFPDPPPVGAPAPEVSIVGWTDDKTHKLSDYLGKVVVLKFWGIWCGPCINSIPSSKEIEAKYAGNPDVVFLGIHSAGGDMGQVRALERVEDWHLVTGIDEGPDVTDGKTSRAYGARGWPTLVIIDREGKIAYNDNLQKWTAVTARLEVARAAKALNVPLPTANASDEENRARLNAISAFRYSELIDRALGEKAP